jgi:hypothetical protein
MGAYSTYGARAACGSFSQQQEQHTPTIMAVPTLGTVMLPSEPVTAPSLSKLSALRQSVVATDVVRTMAPPQPSTEQPPPTEPPATSKYPAGSIQWRSRKDLMWHVAVPATAAFGAAGGAPYVERDVLPEAAPGVRIVDETEGQKATGQLPFYKNWKFWVAVGGVAAAGTGAVLLFRRRRAA